MNFTDRFVKVQILLVEDEESDLPGIPSTTMINPFDISCYHEEVDEITNELSKTLVYLKNGESFVVEMYLHEFEVLLNCWGDSK